MWNDDDLWAVYKFSGGLLSTSRAATMRTGQSISSADFSIVHIMESNSHLLVYSRTYRDSDCMEIWDIFQLELVNLILPPTPLKGAIIIISLVLQTFAWRSLLEDKARSKDNNATWGFGDIVNVVWSAPSSVICSFCNCYWACLHLLKRYKHMLSAMVAVMLLLCTQSWISLENDDGVSCRLKPLPLLNVEWSGSKRTHVFTLFYTNVDLSLQYVGWMAGWWYIRVLGSHEA